MTGNAAQAVLTDAAWTSMLGRVHTALAPGGCFVVESRRPERRAWEEWAEAAPESATVPGVGRVERRFGLTAVALPLVSFRFTYRFPDESVVVSDSTIRFRRREEIEKSLRDASFHVHDVREAPDRPGRELVVVGRRG